MNTGHETRRAESTLVPHQIQHVAEWARSANAYIDEHNALPPDDIDDAAREELVAAMDELGDLVQRYADALRGFADRGPYGDCRPARNDGTGTAGLGTLLKFPTRSHLALRASRRGTDHTARPCA